MKTKLSGTTTQLKVGKSGKTVANYSTSFKKIKNWGKKKANK